MAACGKDAPRPALQRTAPPSAVATTAATQPTRSVDSVDTTRGFDGVVTRKLSGGTCYVGDRYVVAAKDHEVGADLYVRPRAAADTGSECLIDSLPGDMVFRTGDAVARHPDAQNFLGLKGDLLLAWDGTGGASDLYVYDLRKGAKVLEVGDFDVSDLEWADPKTLMIWVTKAYADRAAAAGCPDTLPANPAQLDSLMRLQLPSLELSPTGRFRCTHGQ
jgi:hypothetical protein